MSPVCFDDRTVDLKAGQTIFDSADKLQVRVPTSCKRSGECHECVVEIRRGMEALSEPGPPEGFLRGNYRLACQSEVIDPAARIEFSLLKRQPKILTSSPQRPISHVPLTRRQGDSVISETGGWPLPGPDTGACHRLGDNYRCLQPGGFGERPGIGHQLL